LAAGENRPPVTPDRIDADPIGGFRKQAAEPELHRLDRWVPHLRQERGRRFVFERWRRLSAVRAALHAAVAPA
jgi:hypothetical protein